MNNQLMAKFYWKPVLWTGAYCLLTTGGAMIDAIRQYIEKQERPDEVAPCLHPHLNQRLWVENYAG